MEEPKAANENAEINEETINSELEAREGSTEEFYDIHADSVLNHLSYQLIKSLSQASEINTPFAGHARRTATYAKEIAKRMGRDEDEQFRIYLAALIHDAGNAAVKDSIFESQRPLTADEMTQIKYHTVAGAKILRGVTEIPEVLEAVKWHHERYDGTGYPDGLKGEEIPYCARVIGAAGAYDAMTSERPYRPIMPQLQVRDEFIKGSGTQFDPEICKVILAMINEDKDYDRRQLKDRQWKILLVDDDPMVLKMGEFILGRHKQYSCFKTNSGKLALKLLKDEPDIDLILLDVEMPIMDGVETLIKIRSDKITKDIPVIFVTADSSRETLEKALKFKVNGYITKPFAPHFFIKRINEVLSRSAE